MFQYLIVVEQKQHNGKYIKCFKLDVGVKLEYINIQIYYTVELVHISIHHSYTIISKS